MANAQKNGCVPTFLPVLLKVVLGKLLQCWGVVLVGFTVQMQNAVPMKVALVGQYVACGGWEFVC